MYLVAASREDTASMNIRDFLVEAGDWRRGGEYDGYPVLRLGQRALLVTIGEAHLYHDDIDSRVSDALGVPMPEVVIFLSRHKSESALRTLTVHPIGCYGSADYGGRSGTLVPSAPAAMTAALRRVHALNKEEGLDFKVSYECTHHGPFLRSPTFFIEIGSSEEVWPEKAPARLLAAVVMDILHDRYDRSMPVAIGVGGGHYAPRFSDVALGRMVAFGHMVPGYAIGAGDDALEQAVRMTKSARLVYFHRKALKGGEHSRLKDLFASFGLEAVRERDLEPLDV